MRVLDYIKEALIVVGSIAICSVCLCFFILTYPILICALIAAWFSEHYLNRLRFLQRSLNRFKHRDVAGKMEKALTKIFELKLAENAEVPVELVQSYLYLSKNVVFEIDSKTSNISRIFYYDKKKDKIKINIVSSSHGITLSVYQKQLLDLNSDKFDYFNYLPKWANKD